MKTLNTILAQFDNLVSELNIFKDTQIKDRDTANKKIEELNLEVKSKTADIEKANRVANKISKLVA